MSEFPPVDTQWLDLRAYERLAELFPRLLAEESLESLLEAIADAVEELIPCSAVLLYESRGADGALVPLVARGVLSLTHQEPLELTEDSLEGVAMASARPVTREVGPGGTVSSDAAGGGGATAAVPLVARGQAVGCLTIHRKGPAGRLFTDDELRFLARLADITAITLDNARTRAALADMAQTDALTGLLNRRGFFGALDRALAQAQRDESDTSLLTVDVDDLKGINDRFGHAVGDAALVRVAEALLSRTRAGDAVGRLGGDEFAVVLAGAGDLAAAEIRVELEALLASARIDTPKGPIVPLASFGVASTGLRPLSSLELVTLSDLNMYETKHAHKLHSLPTRAE